MEALQVLVTDIIGEHKSFNVILMILYTGPIIKSWGSKNMIRKSWDCYEVVQLISSYFKTKKCISSKEKRETLMHLSSLLRKYALKQGLEIDEKYRNLNGMILQLSHMEYVITDGKNGLPGSPKMFVEMYEIYQTNRAKYEKILGKANELMGVTVTGVGKRERFNRWLSEKYDHNRVAEIFFTLSEVEACLQKRSLLIGSLYDISSEKDAKKMFVTLKENRMFKISHIRKMTFIESSMHSFLLFLKSNKQIDDVSKMNVLSDELYVPDQSLVIEETAEPNSPVIDGTIQTVDLNKTCSLTYTKPIGISYFGEEVSVRNWADTYVRLCRCMLEDYAEVFQKLINQPITGSGRIDFADAEHSKEMTAPKMVSNNLFIETNLSATDIVKKIATLLKLCAVEYSNLVILYKSTASSPNRAHMQRLLSTRKTAIHNYGDEFYQWLNKEEGMAETTCRSYISAINSAEQFAKEHQIASAKIYRTVNYWEAKETIDSLLKNDIFIEHNNQQHNRFSAAMKKYLEYLSGENVQQCLKFIEDTIDLEPYKEILAEKYPKGFRIQSVIEMKKFRHFWNEKFGAELEEEDDVVRQCISRAGIQYQDFVYLPEEMLNDSTDERLVTYIDNTFAEGKKAIYYDALFKEFSSEFLGQRINNSDMLKIYLAYFHKGKYFFDRSYLASDVNVDIDPVDEVRNCMKAYGAPMKLAVLYETLCHIPQKKIKQILNCNKEYIYNASEEYFHADVVDLTHTELENIADLIQQAIDDKEFISGNELIYAISTKYPVLMERFTMITTVGLRDAIGFKLSGAYAFTGNIISSADRSLSMYDVFADYCSHRDHVTLDELNNLKTELNATIYFDAVYQNLLRINQDDFVSKDRARFDVEATDAAIERFCTGNYISLGEFSQFGSFPDAGFPWTCYLLEHYVSDYSRNYELMHSSFNAYNCVGAIVKRNTGIKDFNDLIANVLADSNIIHTKESALQYLYDNGFLARRRYTEIEQIIINANGLRIQKGQN